MQAINRVQHRQLIDTNGCNSPESTRACRRTNTIAVQLVTLDWIVIAVYGGVTTALGLWFARRAGSSVENFFVAGRSLPWWLAGTSIAATWFATDAPLVASSLVRQQGIFGNWLWWYEAAGVMMLVFFYARMWRRARIITDAEFIELRYSGKPAAILRGFSALYQGVLKNCVVMGWVMLAMVKFSKVLLGWDAAFTLTVCITLAVLYTVASGLWGVVVTDFLQFLTGMLGSVLLAGIVLYKFGGPAEMADQIMAISGNPATLDIIPNPAHISSLEAVSFFLLIFVLWTRSGQGDGYIAQRLFATRDEKQSLLSALWFNFAGTVMMTWPWVIVGLGSLLVFPLAVATPELAADPELAYPMMIAELMPAGLRGMMVASFLAAFMSTMDTHLCWGASYLVNDVYRRFMRQKESERHYVIASRVAVMILVTLAAITAWQMESIERGWIYVIEITAGIAVVWLLRWYWWRVNAWAEISAIASSFVLANGFLWADILAHLGVLSGDALSAANIYYSSDYDMVRAVAVLLIATVVWVVVALLTKPDSEQKLVAFYRRVRPGGWWGAIAAQCPDIRPDVPASRRWLGWGLGMAFIWSSLLGVGYLATGHPVAGLIMLIFGAVTAWFTVRVSLMPDSVHTA